MGRLGRGLRKITKTPGVPQARHIAERTVAPYLRSDIHDLGIDHAATERRVAALELRLENVTGALREATDALRAVESHQPAILNAVASTNGTARLLTRENEALKAVVTETSKRTTTQVNEMDAALREFGVALHVGDEAIRDDLRPHIHTLAWLLQRVETIRAEMMHELRYGAARSGGGGPIDAKIVNPDKLKTDELRINFGAGHIALGGFVNVDMRELPGIDVVAPVDALPFEAGSLTEIFSSHTVEHFPELELRRKLLPYWIGLLKPGGTFRAIVPDLEAMSKAYVEGDMSFEILRSVLYGGQEYEGDFHFTGFTPDSLGSLLVDAGLENPHVIARGRQNGDCLEFEISATKPST